MIRTRLNTFHAYLRQTQSEAVFSPKELFRIVTARRLLRLV